jgi:hypothetical protein
MLEISLKSKLNGDV